MWSAQFQTVVALQPASPGDFNRGAQRLGDEMPYFAVIWRIPMFSLVLELQHCRSPANASAGSK